MPNQSDRRAIAQIAAHTSWANTTDRTARTAAGRAAMDQKFLDQADGDPARAESLRRAHMAKLARASAAARRRKAAEKADARRSEVEALLASRAAGGAR